MNWNASVRARLKALARSMGRAAAEIDYQRLLDTGKQPFKGSEEV